MQITHVFANNFTGNVDTFKYTVKGYITLHGVLITRRISFTEYWKYFVARFNDIHAVGYNSAGSERIWMKFGLCYMSGSSCVP